MRKLRRKNQLEFYYIMIFFFTAFPVTLESRSDQDQVSWHLPASKRKRFLSRDFLETISATCSWWNKENIVNNIFILLYYIITYIILYKYYYNVIFCLKSSLIRSKISDVIAQKDRNFYIFLSGRAGAAPMISRLFFRELHWVNRPKL